MVTALTVNYNTPECLERLLTSFRRFYPDIPYMVVDGSDSAHYMSIQSFSKRFNVQLVHFDYNIHHAGGLVYGIKEIKTNQILFVDSDMIIHKGGWLEQMVKELREDSYGIGDIQKEYYIEIHPPPPGVTMSTISARNKMINGRMPLRPFPDPSRIQARREKVWVDYLHPAFALVNKEVIQRYPNPIKGGAPLIEAMKRIWLEGSSQRILQRAQWLTDDLWLHKKQYIQHNDDHVGMGTVRKTGGYHLC